MAATAELALLRVTQLTRTNGRVRLDEKFRCLEKAIAACNHRPHREDFT